MMRRNEGFTLIELIVTIAVATLITAAATSTLLLGLRINTKTTENVKQQNATNMLNHVVQTVAEYQNITVSTDKLAIVDEGNNEIVYVEFVGDVIKLNGTEFMDNVDSFTASLSSDNQLLTVTIKTNGETYTAASYCRTNPTPTPVPTPTPTPPLAEGGTT